MGLIKLLFLADTHLGFDLPFKPRIARRRRGEDFFKNYEKALEPAREGDVHAVIHGGDLLFRSKVPAELVDMAMKPLKKIADLGVKVYIVPGNHERSRIPFGLLSLHPNIHIFHKPTTYVLEGEYLTLALAGFPYWRENVRGRFSSLLEATGWRENRTKSDALLLCVHHCFEGATVGPKNYTFRDKEDVIRTPDIPKKFTAVCTGHIHRFQVLTKDLSGRLLPVPILYPGSIERTSFAEKSEKKGYLRMTIRSTKPKGPTVLHWKFQELSTRPMIDLHLVATNLNHSTLRAQIRKELHSCDPEGVVRIHIHGMVKGEALPLMKASSLRAMAPPQMNIYLNYS